MRLLAAFIASLAVLATATHFVVHNGSPMKVTALQGDRIEIRYIVGDSHVH